MLRGDVRELQLGRSSGHEQSSRPFGVIVQSDALRLRSTVLVAPTSTSARPASLRSEIQVDGQTTRVLVEHVGAVDVARLGDAIDRLLPEEHWGIDEALRIVLDLR